LYKSSNVKNILSITNTLINIKQNKIIFLNPDIIYKNGVDFVSFSGKLKNQNLTGVVQDRDAIKAAVIVNENEISEWIKVNNISHNIRYLSLLEISLCLEKL
jgi:hypothetical protein